MNGRNFGAEGFLPQYVVEAFTSVKDSALAQISVGDDKTDSNPAKTLEEQYPDCAFV